jgi:methyl-accepting chemotaxis protein
MLSFTIQRSIMQNEISPSIKSRAYKSVFFTSSLIVAFCTIVVTASLTYMSYTATQRNTDDGVRIRAGEVTTLIAKQAGGALKFGKTEVFDGLFNDAFDGAGGAATAGSVFREEGDLLSTHGNAAAFGDGLDLLVKQAIRTGEPVRSADGFTAVSPVRFGKDDAIVGAVAMRWTSQLLKAQHFQDQLFALLVAGGLGLAVLSGAALFLFLHVSRPLVRLRDSMAEVALEKYDTQVPGQQRGDEVGEIARTLEQFRHKLFDAAEAGRENIFKSAAFEGSNAAMMIVDQELNIQYLNATCQELLTGFNDFFKSIDTKFNPDTLVGRPIDGFLDPNGTLRKIASDPKSLPYHSDLVAGERRVHLAISSVIDADSKHAGCVLELKDVTEDHLNRAAIHSIDANQIRLEMSIDGKLISANTNFSQSIGIPLADLKGRNFDQIFQLHQYEGPAGVDLEKVRQGAVISGRFAAQGQSGDVIFEGSLNLVKDTMDRPLRLVFIGNDVTVARRAVEESRTRQMSHERAQAEVVAALRDVLGRLSEGDLTATIDTSFTPEYEQLREDYNEAVDRLSHAMSGVVGNADLIERETAQIATAADDLARRTESQAATLQKTAAALDEMTSNVQSAADGAIQAASLVDATRQKANASTAVMLNAQSAMSAIEGSSSKISKITDVIEEIAFQTNLLALNAGVEAARAGEAGRGFTVVATEVRALAQRSSEAAGEINDLLSVSNDQVVRGVGLVENASNALQQIVESVREISDKVTDIAESSRRQSDGLADINISVGRLDQVTQQNAAMFEETSAASHTLDNEVKLLIGNIGRFKTKNIIENNFNYLNSKIVNI